MKDNNLYLKKLEFELKKSYNKNYTDVCLTYAKKLLENKLPVIFDFEHLSLLLGIEKNKLSAFIFGNETKMYKKVLIPKKGRGNREILVPSNTLKYIQRWILENILNNIKISEFAKGFEKNISIVDNAKVHLNQKCIINMDLKNFFPTINIDSVFRIFNYYGYTKEISFILSKICTYKGKLPQGSPASPKIANIVCLRLDKRISKLCEKYDAKYTRYADDITISGNKGIENIIKIVREIIKDEGFFVNNQKTRFAYNNKRQEVTGLNINSGKVTISKKYKREIKQEIYYCQKYGVENHLEHIGCNKAFYKEHLYGKVYFVNMVEPNIAKKLLNELEKINWEY